MSLLLAAAGWASPSPNGPPPEPILPSALRDELRGRVGDLRLHPHPDGIILRGRATSYYAKLLVQHAVLKALGLLVVANEIEVRAEPFEHPWDGDGPCERPTSI